MSNDTPSPMRIAILGGAGKEGSGLALRWADAGHDIVIGSRDEKRANEAAAEINERIGRAAATGADNESAARDGELVVLAVPYAAQRAVVEQVADALSGKILIDVTVPLRPPKVNRAQLPEGGSAVVAIQDYLGDAVRVVSAFQNISSTHLKKLGEPIDCDVLVASDDNDAADLVVALARQIGIGAYNVGALANSAVAEALTSALIALNQRYKVPGTGIRITGLPREA